MQLEILNLNGYRLNGKKKMCAALLLLADELVNRIFGGLSKNEAQSKSCEFFKKFIEFIEPKEETDVTKRAYNYILSWVAQNRSKFAEKKADTLESMRAESNMTEVWGKFDSKESVFISSVILEKLLKEAGFNYNLILNEFNKRDWTINTQKTSTKVLRVNGINVRGLEIKLEI